MSIVQEIQSLSPSAIIDLYEIDLTPFGDTIYRFHNGTNDLEGNIIWQDNEYTAYPIEIKGYAMNSKGQIPRPSMKISNRISTFAKFLDATNFPENTNPDAQFATFTNQVYYIDRKVVDNPSYIEFELTAPWDIYNEKLPRRQIIQNTCTWLYRGPECGYAGPDVADTKNNLISSPNYDGQDVCSRNLTGCRLRFEETGILPFGGFPGANRY